MPLTPNKLASEMEKMPLTEDEMESAQAFADAFTAYFYEATGAGIPVAPGSLAPATKAMVPASSGMSKAGAVAIQNGITAFWGVVCGATATIFPGTIPPCTPPPTVPAMAAALPSIFAANTSGKMDKKQSMLVIATAIHTTNLGGITTLPGVPPVPGPIL